MQAFTLDPRLEADTFLLGESSLNLLLLTNDRQYPWCILVPKQAGVQEIYQLSEQQQIDLIKDSSLLAAFMMDTFPLDKMNVAALGNVVNQLHIHHVGRRKDDPAWPAPMWGRAAPTPYTDDEKALFIKKISHSSLSTRFTLKD